MECILRVSGVRFQPEEFLKTSSLSPYRVLRTGEPRIAPKASLEHKDSGFNVSVAEGDELAHQIDGAVKYLRTNKDELIRLQAFDGVESLLLDFGIPWREEQPMLTDRLPLALLKLCSEIGFEIELSHYSVSDER